ncbi:MAG TPA: CheR family methyltransferase [Acidobacteriaceae bacterium]|nr:CheR family methyltransferase [Acidobacteriaceae bacterium]
MDPNEAPKGLGPSSEDISETVAANGESSAVAERPASPPQGEVEVDLAGRAGAVTDEEEQQQRPALPYPVVGFGASAGGLQAVREVMENLPEKTGMAYVLVTHLSPDQKSFLTEIMSRFTRMPVEAIEEAQRPLQDHLYILSPNLTVQLRGGLFHLEPRSASERVPMPIDLFFRSLAADQKNHAIGVVLSGSDSDGALGLKAIKGEGGIAIVQTPETAAHGDMPRNSIAADHVDMVVPPGEIGTELARLAHQFTRPEMRSLEDGAAIPPDEHGFHRILQMLRANSGLELRQYKPDTIRRRIARRMILLRKESLADYARYLQLRNDELRILQDEVLINVTRFFRDPAAWEALSADILPEFFANRPAERPIRVWCAGCSSGEEAYSLAIVLLEYLTSKGLDTTLQIFGTDASERSIEMARAAFYPESLVAEISPERLHRFFVKVEGGYQLSRHVRDCCIFARHNLSNDPPFSHIDFVSCRNVLIYFNQVLQRQVMATFHYALEPGGLLLLGMSESLRDYGESFAPVDRKYKVYSRIGTSLPAVHRPAAPSTAPLVPRAAEPQTFLEVWPELELQRAADRIVLARFGPPGLIVDDRLNILQARGQTSPYVELATGAVSWNLLRVLREGVAVDVREAVEGAIRDNIPVTRTAVYVTPEEGEQQVQIDVLPITSSVSRTRCFMVLFNKVEVDRKGGRPDEQRSLPPLTMDEKERHIAKLRQDLTATRFHLQSLIEERDARNHELVSANEEIQSANEELQSTNEELETTKEELQSANEELQTVNDELQQRNSVLTQTGNDLNNLLTSVNIPLMMLTADLHIRQFTPPMEKLFHVRPSDIGRPVGEIRLQLSIEDITPVLREVLETLAPRELEVQDREGRWHLLRVRPYRTLDNKIEGLVVVLVDIDQLRNSQRGVREARDFATSILESVPMPLVVVERNSTIRTVNAAFRDLMHGQDLAGRSLPELFQQQWGVDGFKDKLEELTASDVDSALEFEHKSTTARPMTLLIRGRSLASDGSRVVLLTMEDITLRRQAEQLSAQQNISLEQVIEHTGRTLTAAQEELRDLTAHLLAAQEEERRHIARELHDDIAQRLSALRMQFDAARDEKDEEAGKKALEAIRGQIDGLNTEVRNLSHRLHPAILDDLGLPAALKALAEDFQEREQMVASYIGSDIPETIPRDVATALYRITQEALRNVAKHAGRTHVKVVLQGQDHLLRLEVRDFGTGFDQDGDVPRQGLGLVSMKERARIAGGKLSVRSGLGEGTTVSAEVPTDG